MRGTYFTTALRINNQAGDYTCTIDDWLTDTITTMTSGTANNYTIPLNSSVNFPIGTQLLVAQEGLGQTTIVATSGVTINAVGLSISSRYKSVALIQVALNEWDAYGTLDAAYTARTTAFATATGITDTTILGALNTFDLGLISNGLATKMKALYPFVGGTSTTCKYNFMDARDLDIAFRLQFNGGWTHSSGGIQGNATNTYADTFLNESTQLTQADEHISIYSRTEIDALYCDMGLAVGSYETNIFSRLTNKFYFRLNNSEPGYSNTSSLGLFIGSRTGNNSTTGFRNTTKYTTLSTYITRANFNIYIGAMNRDNTSINYPTARQYAFSSIGSGLSDTDASNLYTLTQAFQTTLSRQV
jgi:hypothetical protein